MTFKPRRCDVYRWDAYVDAFWRVRWHRSDPNPMPRIHLWSRRRAA